MVLLPAGLLAALGAAPRPKEPDGATLSRQMCSTCHAFTPPDILPKASWKGTETIYAAPHPNWGSSGIQLVDLDKDGDVDVLLTNGDMFDDRLLKPYHGIQWLENRGGYPFTAQVLARMPATHRAVAADLDGDGDLDVAASAFTAGSIGESISRLPSLVWLEQVKPGRFERPTLEMGNMTHATLDVGDFDRDGDADIVVGSFFDVGGSAERWVDVWENSSVSR